MRRNNTAAVSRRLEREHKMRDETMPVGEMTDDEIWSSMYRLQQRRSPSLAARISEIEAERKLRVASGWLA